MLKRPWGDGKSAFEYDPVDFTNTKSERRI